MKWSSTIFCAWALAALAAGAASGGQPPSANTTGAAPTQGGIAANNAAAIAALRSDVDAQFALILSALKVAPPAPSCPSGGPLTTVTVGPGQTFTEMAYAIPCMAPGFKMTVLGGTADVVSFDIPTGLDGWTIQGQADGKESLNGQGGIGGGHRLAWGKGCIHARSPGRVYGIVLTGCGGADNVGDGEAGLYGEAFLAPGTLVADHVMFQSNENGAFVPGMGVGGANVTLDIESCDFVNNGQSKDGLSHDLYVQGPELTVNASNFYGNPYGNQIKSRSPEVHVTGGYNANTAGGRWIDRPDGGITTVTGGIYDIAASSAGENVIGYGEESANNGLGTWVWQGAQVFVGRYNATSDVLSGNTVAFDSASSLTWTGSAASMAVSGGGVVTGLAMVPPAGTVFGSDPTPPAHVSGAQ